MTVPYPFNSKNIKDPSQRPKFQFDICDVHPFLESKKDLILAGNIIEKKIIDTYSMLCKCSAAKRKPNAIAGTY